MPHFTWKSPQFEGINPEEIHELPPIPISLISTTDHGTDTDATTGDQIDADIPTFQPSRLYTALSHSLPTLNAIQKYSSITFTVFSFIHGTTVLLTPIISTSITDELISMGRSIYQAPLLEEVLVYGALSLHVLSGITARLIRGWMYRVRHDEGKRHERERARKRKGMNDSMERDINGELQVTNDNMGLTGGVSGYVGTGPRKSFIYRTLGLSPLQFSGYLSIPLVLFHVLQMRLVPLFVEGDSSYIGVEYVAYLFSAAQGVWRPLLNWAVYPLLILLTTYHTIYGILTWCRVKSLRLRKMAINVISIVSLIGVWSLYVVSKMETGMPGFVAKRFEKYLNVFYWR